MIEVWREAVGFSNYEVSNLGNVRRNIHKNPRSRGWSRKKPGDPITVCHSKAYPYVHIKADNGKLRTRRISKLVCTAFHGPEPPGKPFVLHKDDNPSNNHASNLYWGNQTENCADAKRNGWNQMGQFSCRAKFSAAQVHAIRNEYVAGGLTFQDIADELGVAYSTIRNICNGKTYSEV